MPETPTHHRTAVVADKPLAAAAGVAALKAGGNAIDAAVAAVMVHCVISPSYVGFGGYGGSFIVWLAKEKRAYAIDSDARAPMAFRSDLFTDAKVGEHGYLSVGVPGVLSGMDVALRRFGKRSFKDNASAALDLAANGSVMTAETAKALANFKASTDADSWEAMFPNGAAIPKVGETWVQPDLAAFIKTISDDPRAFYNGPIRKRSPTKSPRTAVC